MRVLLTIVVAAACLVGLFMLVGQSMIRQQEACYRDERDVDFCDDLYPVAEWYRQLFEELGR